MAFRTRHRFVGIDQFEICKIVVEGLAIELIDVGVASFVVGVALIALQL